MNYYIADTHFGHQNIIKHDAANGCRKFSSIEEHDDLIIKNWNNVVKPGDNVYILGDFSWLYARETEEIIKKLNGNKFLIKGNHDRWAKDGACKKLFQGIYDYKTIQDGNYSVVMSHYPILFYQGQHRGAIHLYGHVHNTREHHLYQEACKHIAETTDIPFRCFNVGCMLWDYKPVALEEILANNQVQK